MDPIALLEEQPLWQLTGLLDGELIVVMRGADGAPFANHFYTMQGGFPGRFLLADFLRGLVASGNLKVLRGSVPTDDND